MAQVQDPVPRPMPRRPVANQLRQNSMERHRAAHQVNVPPFERQLLFNLQTGAPHGGRERPDAHAAGGRIAPEALEELLSLGEGVRDAIERKWSPLAHRAFAPGDFAESIPATVLWELMTIGPCERAAGMGIVKLSTFPRGPGHGERQVQVVR